MCGLTGVVVEQERSGWTSDISEVVPAGFSRALGVGLGCLIKGYLRLKCHHIGASLVVQ